MAIMFIRPALLLLTLAGLALAANRTVRNEVVDLEYYYTVNSDLDADFFLSQVIPELGNPNNQLLFLALPYGGVQIITDDEGKYYCHGKKNVCETSQLQFCLELEFPSFLSTFLSCYFQSELYPVDILGATEQCVRQLKSQADWDTIKSCVADEIKLGSYIEAVLRGQELRPLFEETPHVYLNEDYSALAAIDLKKALCRVKATDIWQCESVDQYKEPLVEIFYEVYDSEANNFFSKRLTATVLGNLINTVSRVDILPNPNKVLDCEAKDDSCWSHRAHWCIFEDYAGQEQLQIIQCTFSKSASLSAKERVKQCLAEDKFVELTNCITALGQADPTAIKAMQSKLNLMVDPAQQTAVEVTIKDQPNVKVKNGVLEEICYNYLHIDDETLGCKVTRPKVAIFYETNATAMAEVFSHMVDLAPLAPFETVADFEFIPYGTTQFANGKYTCDGGEDQCHANWIHACLLKDFYNDITDKFRFLAFFLCTINAADNIQDFTNPIDIAEGCLNQNYIEGPNMWSQLRYCADSDDAIKELMRTKTASIGLTAIPEIVIDGEKKTAEMGNSLMANLCQSFESIKPRACFQIEPNATQVLQVTVYLTGDQATQTFVQSQIKPLLTAEPRDQALRLREIIEWQFVPWGPSSYNSTSGEIKCANGASECLANRIVACAARQQDNGRLGNRETRQRVASFLVCFFDLPNWANDPLDAANQCTSKLSPLDSYPALFQCAAQEGKQQLVLDMMEVTKNNYPAISKFPEVAIQSQRIADPNKLVQSLCDSYQGSPVPAECTTPSGKAFVGEGSTLWLVLLVATGAYLSSTHV